MQGCKIFVFNQFETEIKVGEKIEKYNTSIRSIQLLKMREKNMTFFIFHS